MQKQKLLYVVTGLSIAVNLFFAGVMHTSNVFRVDNRIDFNPVVRPNITEEVERYNSRTVVEKPMRYNNIQSAHESVDYRVTGSNALIEDVDFCNRLYGSSMQPTIFDDNTVCYREYAGGEIGEGSIVRYEAGDEYNAHRIKGSYFQRGYVVTQGDNNRRLDGRVNISSITHVAVAVIYT